MMLIIPQFHLCVYVYKGVSINLPPGLNSIKLMTENKLTDKQQFRSD